MRSVAPLKEPERSPGAKSLRTHLLIQVGTAALFAVLGVIDLVATPSLTQYLYIVFHGETFRFIAVLIVLSILLALSAVVYLVVWRAARSVQEELTRFIARNFRYLSVASFASDLFIKFSAVALVILARRPDWVAAVMVACAGDYLIQGRGFVLPVRLGMLLGLVYLIAATVLLIWFEGYLAYGFFAVVVPALLSTWHLRSLLRQRSKETLLCVRCGSIRCSRSAPDF